MCSDFTDLHVAESLTKETFPFYTVATLSKINWLYVWLYFWALCYVPLIYMSVFVPNHTILITVALQYC